MTAKGVIIDLVPKSPITIRLDDDATKMLEEVQSWLGSSQSGAFLVALRHLHGTFLREAPLYVRPLPEHDQPERRTA